MTTFTPHPSPGSGRAEKIAFLEGIFYKFFKFACNIEYYSPARPEPGEGCGNKLYSDVISSYKTTP